MRLKPWADGPLHLIKTPSMTQEVGSHESVYIANEMAFAHNAMLRGINSIYHQALNVRHPRDIADLLFFAKTWSTWVAHHHELEETRMFPGFEQVAGKTGLLNSNVEQHHAFSGGLQKLKEYAVSTDPSAYSGSKLQSIIDEFSAALQTHLHEEIDSLLSLRLYDGKALLEVYKQCEAAAGDQPKVKDALLFFFASIRLLSKNMNE
ncbi:MAG: hypothetical protein M1820_002545 [Bogoriella megaspora]|nr:MAG: hypothetical protein M1820_002545 [Bogoriella megaspora]